VGFGPGTHRKEVRQEAELPYYQGHCVHLFFLY
jgi:hypothetical protein